ncbi:MAG: response regulator transcription factor [Chloroflexota bacterium]|nr:response regulator transcription factor [Chloroflexota bacterium]
MNKIRVLLAEDHVLMREGTRELVQYEPDIEVVGETGDGKEAVTLAGKLRPNVIIMDISMPGLNGIEATRQIKKLYPEIAVLVLTAYDNDQYIFSILEAGAAGYLLKNISPHDLIEAIRAVREGESVFHPAIARKVLERLGSPDKPGDRPAVESLSRREMDVLRLAAKGISNKEIADNLVLSPKTIKVHLWNIFQKLGVGSRTEAVLYAIKKGWIEMEEIP